MDMVNERKATSANVPEDIARAKMLHLKIMNKRRHAASLAGATNVLGALSSSRKGGNLNDDGSDSSVDSADESGDMGVNVGDDNYGVDMSFNSNGGANQTSSSNPHHTPSLPIEGAATGLPGSPPLVNTRSRASIGNKDHGNDHSGINLHHINSGHHSQTHQLSQYDALALASNPNASAAIGLLYQQITKMVENQHQQTIQLHHQLLQEIQTLQQQQQSFMAEIIQYISQIERKSEESRGEPVRKRGRNNDDHHESSSDQR
jgi:hypothetical protein